MRRLRSFFIVLTLLAASACSEDVENTYNAVYPAHFVYTYVNTVPQLYAAMNSSGIFTVIQATGQTFRFTGENGKYTDVNKTAIDAGASVQMGIAGFIAGLPNTAELGHNSPTPVCFDLACPYCFENYHIERSLSLKAGGQASCPTCQRVYNLNDYLGQATDGTRLYRYHITYSGNTVAISSR